MVGSVEDDVIEDGDAHDFSGLFHALGDVHVGAGGLQGPHGMVVGEDDGNGSIADRSGKDFPRVSQGSVYETDGDDADVDDFIGAVDGGAEEVLLLAVGVVPDMGNNIGGVADLDAFGLDASPNEFDGGEDEGGLGVPDAIELGEVPGLDVEALFVDDFDQPAGQCHDVGAGYASAQEYRQQVLIAEGHGAF